MKSSAATGKARGNLRDGRSDGVTARFRLGEAFNPYRIFTGLFIPEGLARSSRISGGAKLAWGRLARYSGHDGRCYPSMKTLGQEIGVGTRQAQNYVAELERNTLIRRITRFCGRGQTSNAFEFLWHELFEHGVNDSSGEGVNDRSWEGMHDRSPKESHFEESQIEESQRERDLDYPPTNRKNRDSRMEVEPARSGCKQYPRLREALADYMMADDGERVYPKDRHVIDVMNAAPGASEGEVIACLRYLREERGLRPGTKHGPRSFAWFKTTVGDYFQQKAAREMVYRPATNDARLSREQFNSMLEAIEAV